MIVSDRGLERPDAGDRLSRVWNILATAGTGWLARFVAVACQLMIVRRVTSLLTQDEYAALVLLNALTSWIGLADLGTRASLQNNLSELRAHGRASEGLVRTALQINMLVAAVVFLALFANRGSLASLYLKPLASSPATVREAAFVLGTGALVLSTVGQLSLQILYSAHKGYIAVLLPTVGQVLSLLALSSGRSSVLFVIGAFFLPTAVLYWIALLWSSRRALPTIHVVDWRLLKGLLARGSGFWRLALLGAIILQTDAFFLSQVSSSNDLARYSLLFRMYAFPTLLFSYTLQAAWPHFTEWFALNELQEFRKRFKGLLVLGLIGVGTAVLLISLTSSILIKIIAPKLTFELPLTLLLAFSAMQLIRVWTDTFSMALQSANMTRPIWRLASIQAIVGLAAQYVLARRFGGLGIVCATALSFITTCAWGLPVAFVQRFVKSQTAVLEPDQGSKESSREELG